MRNRILFFSILLLVVGVVLFNFRQAAFDKAAIVKEQVAAINVDFQKRVEAARLGLDDAFAGSLFSSTATISKQRPDFAYYQYEKGRLVAWSYEGFHVPEFPPIDDESLIFNGDEIGLFLKLSQDVWSFIPVDIPEHSCFEGWVLHPNDFPVSTKSGFTLGYLDRSNKVTDYGRSIKVLIALGLFFLLFSYWLLLIARWVRAAQGEKWGGGVLIGGLSLFGLMYYVFNFNQALGGLSFFSGTMSVGSWLVYAGLLLWVAIIFFRRFDRSEKLLSNFPKGLALTNYLLSLLALLLLEEVLKFPFENWSSFANPHVLDLNGRSLGFLIFACLLVLSYFFFSHRLALNTHALALARNERLIILTGTVLLFGMVITWFGGDISGMKLALVGFIYLVLFDFYLDSDTSSLTWLISWIFVLSVFLTLLFYYYHTGVKDEVLTLFSLFFSLITVFVLILALSNVIFRAVPFSESFPMLWGATLRNKIQLYVIILTLGSFIAIGLVTASSFNKYSHQKRDTDHFSKVELAVKIIEENLRKGESIGPVVNKVSALMGSDINWYNKEGRGMIKMGKNFSPLMEPNAFEQFKQSNVKSINTTIYFQHELQKTTYIPIKQSDGKRLAYIEIPYEQTFAIIKLELFDFLGNLLTVYVFLLLIISSLSIVISNLITQPISEMGQKLKDVSLDGNESLTWEGDDEIGRLVENYNGMIAKLEKSTALLRQSEREHAWREMAKQVAHEIKNPLTPMKLSIQHLMRVYQADPEQAAPLIKSMSKTLIEQIEGLATIANEFSNFAKMPKAVPQQLSFSNLVKSVVQLFIAQPENNRIKLLAELPKEEIFVEADKNHLTRILNNLIKNAIQAIQEEQEGLITLRLFRRDSSIVMQVEDNGVGIPEEIQPKVFQPNFTTKNSGTGIGLAMTKNMVENAGGEISFRTTIGEGTIFEIIFPA